MTEAYRQGDWQGTFDSAEDLRLWIERGGFPPDGHTRESIARLGLALAHDSVYRSGLERTVPPCP